MLKHRLRVGALRFTYRFSWNNTDDIVQTWFWARSLRGRASIAISNVQARERTLDQMVERKNINKPRIWPGKTENP